MESKSISCEDCSYSTKIKLFGRTAYKCDLVPTAHFPVGWGCVPSVKEVKKCEVD